MAITDNTKKKLLPDEEGIGAGLGIPGGLVAPSGAGKPKGIHSPVQPGLTPPEPPTPLGRSAANIGAAASDAFAAPGKAIADVVNRAGVGIRNLGREAVGLPDLQPMQFNYDAAQDKLAQVRAQNAGTAPAPTPAAPIGSAQAAPRPVVQPPAMHLIEPSNAASMGLAPPSAPTPAAVGSGLAAAVPPASPVVGQFNGRDITADQAAAIAGRLPVAAPGAAPVGAPGGGFAFAPPGSLTGAAAATAPAPAETMLDVPRFAPPSVNTGRVAAAEKERAGLVKQLSAQIASMASSPSGLNSRGERQLYAQLIAQRAGLTQQAGDLAGTAAGQQVDAATSAGVAGMGQAGENARALLREAGDTSRTQISESGANARAAAALNPPEYVTDASGNVTRVQGTQAAPVTGPDGQPLQAPRTKAEGAITPAVQLDALVKQLQAEQSALKPDPQRIASIQQQISGLMPGGAPAAKPTLEQFMAAARKANPGAADSDLTAFYNQKYGQ